MRVVHPFEPIYDKNSKILVLGSFPSLKSREQEFFYGHPQNRFWRVIADICGCEPPETVQEKRKMLIDNGIAIWDVIGECDIEGSADSTIKNVKANDISGILAGADIKKIIVNGKTAEKYYNKYIKDRTGREAVYLPSTSPANAAWSMTKLAVAWGREISYILGKTEATVKNECGR